MKIKLLFKYNLHSFSLTRIRHFIMCNDSYSLVLEVPLTARSNSEHSSAILSMLGD